MANLNKLTTLLVVDSIEAALPAWRQLGYEIKVRVPEQGELGFVILEGPPGELMLQTRASLREDMREVAERAPSFLLYADVSSLSAVRASLKAAKVLVTERKTFYGATESWLELPGGSILGLAQH